MTARVLVVDDTPANVKLLEARLTAEYYDVTSAISGPEAIEICRRGQIDIVLLDVMMPGMDGFEACALLKADPLTAHIPIIIITALDEPSNRVRGLEAGADDFLTKPVDDVQLLARVKSLVRLKVLSDELRSRAVTGQSIAIEDAMGMTAAISADGGRILLVDSDPIGAERLAGYLSDKHHIDIVSDPGDTTMRAAEADYELAIVSMTLGDVDPLRVCSQLRTLEQTRLMPILLVAEQQDRPLVLRGLELGVNDFIQRPIERNELAARVATQIRRHRYSVELRNTLSDTVALAVIDELTGLYNRRYFDRHLALLLSKAKETGRTMCALMLDIDFFKSVNDTYGHDIGDLVLKEFAERLQRNIRGADLACRYGGEEFVVLIPDTDLDHAQMVAERIRKTMATDPINAGFGDLLLITVSVGIAINELPDDTPETIMKRADIALYRAKRQGRNQVVYDAA
ncbi:MAG: PleD family two-component system response regulator [Alphaproteobacteria bacterium]|nr:PleD family two-component system response regulator [Alphaproteobacteria bacterium]